MSHTKAETAVSYAALILADAKVVITPEKLQTILHASGIEDVEPIWTSLFAKALEGKDIKEILTTVSPSAPVKQEEATPETDIDGKSDGDQADDFRGESGDGGESDEDLGNLFDL